MKNITPIYLLTIAWKRIWILILAAVVFAVGTFSYCKILLTPTYSSTASLIVTNGAIVTGSEMQNGSSGEKVSGGDISASIYLAETIIDILNTNDIYEAVAQEIGGYTAEQLKGMSNIQRRNENTLFLDVSFTCSDPTEAKNLANEYVEVACEYVVQFIPYANAKVAATAVTASKVGPTTIKNTLIAAVFGAVVAYAILVFLDQTKKEIVSKEDFIESFEIPLLGAVPDFEGTEYTADTQGEVV